MADQFEVIEATLKLLTVRHLAEEHLYTFHVVEDHDGRLILGHDNMRENAGANMARLIISLRPASLRKPRHVGAE